MPLRDNLYVLKEDGVYIVSGSSPSNFSVRLLDNSVFVTAPDTAVVLNNQIYCLTNQGICVISDTGVSIISSSIDDIVKLISSSNYDFKFTFTKMDNNYYVQLIGTNSCTVRNIFLVNKSMLKHYMHYLGFVSILCAFDACLFYEWLQMQAHP